MRAFQAADQRLIVRCPESSTSGSLWNASVMKAQLAISTLEGRTSGLKYASESNGHKQSAHNY